LINSQKKRRDEEERKRVLEEQEQQRRHYERLKKAEEDRNQLLSTFDSIAPEVIDKILALAQGDVDRATEELMIIFEKQQEETDLKEQLEEEEKRRASIIMKAHNMFDGVPEQTVRLFFETNNWNPRNTIRSLVAFWEEQERKKKEEEEKKMKKEREEMVTRLANEFQTDPEIVRNVLESNHWDEQQTKILILNLENKKTSTLVLKKGDRERKSLEEDLQYKIEKEKAAQELAEQLQNEISELETKTIEKKKSVKEFKIKTRNLIKKKLQNALPHLPNIPHLRRWTATTRPMVKEKRFFGVSLEESLSKCEQTKTPHILDIILEDLKAAVEMEGLFR
jgi:hypothetical protein